jgi:hypothetical protein
MPTRTGPKRRYQLDEAFFASINTEEKAYWLGFLLADGCVRKFGAGNWALRIDLQCRDELHLQKLLEALRTDSPIRTRKNGESKYAVICSAKLCRDLIALECGPNKTCQHCTPAIPSHLLRHFYRGVMDGDGSFGYMNCRRKTPQLWLELVGSRQFIYDFREWACRTTDANRIKVSQIGRAYRIRWAGNQQVKRILDLLYADAEITLDRKLKRYMQIVA